VLVATEDRDTPLHRIHHPFTAFTVRAALGSEALMGSGAKGSGASARVTRSTRASRWSKASFRTREAISGDATRGGLPPGSTGYPALFAPDGVPDRP